MSEEKRNFVKEDLFRLKFIQGAALSPDGKKVVYILNRYKTEKKDEKEEIQDQKSLWLADLESGTERQFTSEKTGGAARPGRLTANRLPLFPTEKAARRYMSSPWMGVRPAN